MSADEYPSGVDDCRDTPPEFTSEGELHIGVDDYAISQGLQDDAQPIGENDAALFYELVDVLHDHVTDGDVAPVQAWTMLESLADGVQDDVGATDTSVLGTRFAISDPERQVYQRPRNRFQAVRLAVARRVAP